MNAPDTNAAHGSRAPSARLAEAVSEPTVVEVLRVEEPTASDGRRRVIARWSDGSVGRAVSYLPDEILVSEGDMIGKTAGELRALHFARDRDFLQRGD